MPVLSCTAACRCLPTALSCGLHDGSVIDSQQYHHALKAWRQGGSHLHRRQLLSSEALEAIDTLDMTEAIDMVEQLDAYPRDSSTVHKYLQDALKSGPQEVPVWFVVVTDPR